MILALVLWLQALPGSVQFSHTFEVGRPSEVVATVRARCAGCSWGEPGTRGGGGARLGRRHVFAAHPVGARKRVRRLPDHARRARAGPARDLRRARFDAQRGAGRAGDHRTHRRQHPRRRRARGRSGAVDGAHPPCAAEHRRPVHGSPGHDVVRDRADRSRPAVPVLGDLHERRRRHRRPTA